jgi:hypothetical protein
MDPPVATVDKARLVMACRDGERAYVICVGECGTQCPQDLLLAFPLLTVLEKMLPRPGPVRSPPALDGGPIGAAKK